MQKNTSIHTEYNFGRIDTPYLSLSLQVMGRLFWVIDRKDTNHKIFASALYSHIMAILPSVTWSELRFHQILQSILKIMLSSSLSWYGITERNLQENVSNFVVNIDSIVLGALRAMASADTVMAKFRSHVWKWVRSRKMRLSCYLVLLSIDSKTR